MNTAPPQKTRPGRLADVGLAVVLVGVVVRMTATFDPMPAWSGDPFTSAAPIVGLTPALSMLLDAFVLLGAVLILLSHIGRSRGAVIAASVAAVGVVPGMLHALSAGGDALDDTVIVSAWSAAIIGGVAVWAACRHEQRWRIAAAILLGAIGMLAAKGLVQNYIDHPETVAMYRQNREAILAANGWSPDSAMARAYERRLLNAEATGWFGLSNVYASFMAAAAVSGAALLLFARVRREAIGRGVLAMSGLMVVGGVCGLLMTGSKGAIAAAALGAGLVVVAAAARRFTVLQRRPVAVAIVAAAVVLPLLGVAAMTLLPETKANLSLLFRWFYIVGASRTIAAEPLIGVGPAGFKDAYQILKPPASPEDVSSPHSMAFDWLAALGIAGLTWVVLTLAGSFRAARGMLEAEATETVRPEYQVRPLVRVIFIIAAIGTAAAAATEMALATPEASLVRAVGLVAWVLVGVAVANPAVSRQVLLVGIAGGAVTLLAHAQIEMTSSSVTSALPWAVWIGVAAAGVLPIASQPAVRRPIAWVGAAAVLVFVAVSAPRVFAWDFALRRAAGAATPVAAAAQRAGVLAQSGRWSGPEGAAFADELSGLLGRRVAPNPRDLERAVAELRIAGVRRALPDLESAAAQFPHHGPTARALSRLHLDLAFAAGPGDPAGRDAAAEAAVRVAGDAAAGGGGSSGWGWVGTLRRTLMSFRDDPSDLPAAVDAYERAAAAGPYSVLYPAELARLHAQAGDANRAAEWARKALELQKLTRLDPLVGLTERQEREMRALANP